MRVISAISMAVINNFQDKSCHLTVLISERVSPEHVDPYRKTIFVQDKALRT